MNLTWQQIRENALGFQTRWADARNERAEAQPFLYEFLGVFGVDPRRVANFESDVDITPDSKGYIDMLWRGRILVEMKSRGQSLDRAYNQAKKYAFSIVNDDDLPEFIMVCDFENIRLYRQTTNQQWEFKTCELSENVELFSVLTNRATELEFVIDKELNIQAAYKMAKLHDLLKESNYTGHSLELFLVRLLFCLFADHSGIFNKRQFHKFVLNSHPSGSDLSGRLIQLFDVLNTSLNERLHSLTDDLKEFSYVNGGLFAETIRPAAFDNKMRNLLLECCEFDWSDISPTIFGAMFQEVMDPAKRSELGAQFTPREVILNVITPLFLESLHEELRYIGNNMAQLDLFHQKLASLTFLDPACGCGNFLMVTYHEMRLLELEVLRRKYPDVTRLPQNFNLANEIKVNVCQFYGIEIEEFPGQIARVAMWLVDQKMNNLVSQEFGMPFSRLPLSLESHIYHGPENGNALRVDWSTIVPAPGPSYIIGNPPFYGARKKTQLQKKDLKNVLDGIQKSGDLDYVAAWFMKAAQMMHRANVKAAYVSTNSITQGEQVAILWKPLIEQLGIQIQFAYRAFKWNNGAKGSSTVHCVIIGFSKDNNQCTKVIYDEEGNGFQARNINPYLLDAGNILIHSRRGPLCDVPKMRSGNKPIDDGNYLFTKSEMEAFIALEPKSEAWFRPWYGSTEFINKNPRYCLFLQHCPPDELRQMPEAMRRIEAVRQHRFNSTSDGTKRLADYPLQFHVKTTPVTEYILVPEVSSEGRKYIPIGFMSPENLCSNLAKLVPGATIYHFGILTSSVHMAWVRAFGGRHEMRYRYSIQIVYNNFPWPEPSDAQRKAIESAAQRVLEARELFSNCSYADLYDIYAMPEQLRKAHDRLDRAVMDSYGFNRSVTEMECVTALLERYQVLISSEKS